MRILLASLLFSTVMVAIVNIPHISEILWFVGSGCLGSALVLNLYAKGRI